MEVGEPAGRYQNLRSVLWIIEHVWKHKMMDVLQVVNVSCWPDLDLQRLSLEESWRLRVGSAYVFSVVRSRDVALFERALDFLEAAYQLLPGLVAAIKHMKIMFGLKTLVVMTMLRDGRGSMDIVSKINLFFPNRLPQYLDRCTQREMFLMRKNHMDFKGLAQALALDKNRLREYLQSEMEEQYGERYAQKVEDRLLQYLQELEGALPGDTHIDKILKKQSPSSEEEKLLDVLTAGGATITATLNKLLHCDVTSCRPDKVSQAPDEAEARTSGLSRTPQDFQSGVFRNASGAPVFTVNQKARTIRQFCSKHQRWVRSILQECPDDCAVSASPPLFPSSSSSSQDLTPSNLVPSPSDRPLLRSAVGPAAGQGCGPSAVQPVDVVSSSTSKPRPPGPDHTHQNPPSPSGSHLTPVNQTSRTEGSPQHEMCSSRKTSQDEPPGDGVTSESAGQTGPGPEPVWTADGLSSSRLSPVVQLDEVASSSRSIPKPLDCGECCHQWVTPGSWSLPPRQISGFADVVSGRSDIQRLPDSPESPSSKKHTQSFRQTLKCSTSQLLADEGLRDPGDLQTSCPNSSCDLRVYGSSRCPVSPSTTQRPEQEEKSSESESPQLPSSSEDLPAATPSPPVQLVNTSSSSPSQLSPTSPDDTAGSQQPAAIVSNLASNQSSGISVSVSAQPPESQDEWRSGSRLLRPRRSSRHFSTVEQSEALRRKLSNKNPESSGCPPPHGATSRSRGQTVRGLRPGDRPRPSALTPVVRLVDIYPHLKRSQASPCDSVPYYNSRSLSGSRPPLCRTSRDGDASSRRLTTDSVETAPPNCHDLPSIPHKASKPSSQFSKTPLKTGPRAPTSGLHQTQLPPAPPVRLSLSSQTSLLRSKILQPFVSLTRLEDEERRATGAPAEPRSEEDDVDSSFDLNELYSGSEGSDGDADPDPDYKPSLKKKRFLLEYENAKMADNDL